MKDILVHYTSQERDEDTGLYTDVVYKGYISNIGTVVQVIKWP